MASGVRVTGLNKVVRELQALGLEVDDLKDAFADIASDAAQKAAGYAPRRSGRLVGSIRGNRAKNKAVVTAGKAKVPYAGAINYGWRRRRISPNPFMQKADADMAPVVVERLTAAIETIINERGL